MTFKIGDLVRRVARPGPSMLLGTVWEVVGVSVELGSRIQVPLYGWYADDAFVLEQSAPEPTHTLTTTPHKWAKEIKAWADGAVIQCNYIAASVPRWEDCKTPHWRSTNEYRIKPEKKPDVVVINRVGLVEGKYVQWNTDYSRDVSFTFDGDTGKLKAVELINN